MFKKWSDICKIPNTHMLWAVATLDLESETGRRFTQAFPEYFAEEESPGPYPLSLICEEAHKNGLQDGNDNGENFPITYEGVPSWIPIRTFDIHGNNLGGGNFPTLPDGINPESQQGETVRWGDETLTVLENNERCEELSLAPAEAIDVDH